ncbi:MAG: hypothetical protein P1P87_00405, partial [Trueperaceae bacterium]|nr:hypothetical protein [Trueperaceae bacterium]
MPSERFTGFGPAVTDWFVALGYDNSRSYWAATKDVWQRDVRDAAPLKTATGGYLPGTDGSPAARYLEVSAGGLYV